MLCAVFVPSAFITGISGQFYRQFALTIAGATIISLIVSLTLSPALCALLLKPHDRERRDRWWERPIHGFFRLFNCGLRRACGRLRLARRRRSCASSAIMLVVYAGVLAYGLNEFRKTPIGFIPQVDRGYLIVVTQLPPGASLARTDEVSSGARRHRAQDARRRARGELRRLLRRDLHQCAELGRDLPDARAVARSARKRSRASRPPASQAELFQRLAAIQEALIFVIQPPPVRGHRQCRRLPHDGRGPRRARLAGAAGSDRRHDGARAAQTPGLHAGVHAVRELDAAALSRHRPHQGADARRQRRRRVRARCRSIIGSAYVNDFNLLGRTFRVTAQADAQLSVDEPSDVLKIRVRNSSGDTVPLGSFTTVRDIAGPVPRAALQSLSGGRARRRGRARLLARARRSTPWRSSPPRRCRDGFGYEWTTLAFQQIAAGSTALFAFALAVVFVFLVLAAQFESLTLPLGRDPDRADVPGRLDHAA